MGKQKTDEWFNHFKMWFSQLGEDTNPIKYEKAFKAGWDAAKNPLPHTPTVKVEDVCKDINETAERWFNEHKERWGDSDPSMVETGRTDAEDLRNIAETLRRGEFKDARAKAAHLDTIVRDELPDSFFQLLRENGIKW